jgi:hypothetical protein
LSTANYTTIETAIYAWALARSGLASTNVLWAFQTTDTQKPTGQFVTLKLDTGSPIGSHPEHVHSYDAGADLGAEITLETLEVVRASLSVQVIGGGTNGDSSARAVASKLQRSLALDTAREAFLTAGFSILDRGTIQHLPEILDADFEARAVFDVQILLSDGVTETIGYIATVQVEDTLTEDTFSVTLE